MVPGEAFLLLLFHGRQNSNFWQLQSSATKSLPSLLPPLPARQLHLSPTVHRPEQVALKLCPKCCCHSPRTKLNHLWMTALPTLFLPRVLMATTTQLSHCADGIREKGETEPKVVCQLLAKLAFPSSTPPGP